MVINIILAAINVSLGLLVAYENARFYLRFRGISPRHWVKLWYAVIGLYWAGIFAYTIIYPRMYNPDFWHSGVIKPAITVTLSALAASAIMRRKTNLEGK